jgi:hypothetical protein
MPHSKPSAFGIYVQRNAAEAAVERLKDAGFGKHELSLLYPHNDPVNKLVHSQETKVLKGAEIGASAGAIIGGVLGWIASAGLLLVPGVGTIFAAGPIATLLITIPAAAGVGGLWGGLIGLGIPEKEAKHFYTRLHKGDILLSVHCDDEERMMTAKDIMIHTGAEDVYSRRDATVKA